MVKRKIIVDSDDEEEGEHDEPEIKHHKGDAKVILESSPPARIADTSLSSASSTDILSKEIEAAHRRLVEPTPVKPIVTGMPQGMSQAYVRDAFSGTSIKSQQAQTSMDELKLRNRFRGSNSRDGSESRDNGDVFDFHGSSDVEIDAVQLKDRRCTDEKQASTNCERGQHSQQPKMLPPNSKGLLRNQSQLSETATIPTIVDTSSPDANATPSKMTPSNVAWTQASTHQSVDTDGRMPTPTMSSHSRGTEGTLTSTRSNCKVNEHESFGSVGDRPQHNDTIEELGSAASVAPPRNVKSNGLAIESPHENDGASIRTDNPSFLALQTGEYTKVPVKFPNEGSQSAPENEQHCLSSELKFKEQRKSSKERKRKRELVNDADELGSDDVHVGFPKEQYQPRPSRSRGGQENEELMIPTDFSKRPEASAKSKSKSRRSKSAVSTELIPKDPDEDKDEESAPRDPNVEVPAFDQENDHLDVLEGPDDTDATAFTDSSKTSRQGPKANKKRGRPKKAPDCIAIEHEPPNSIVLEKTAEAVTQVEQAEKPTKRGRPSKKSKATVDKVAEPEKAEQVHAEKPRPNETAPEETSHHSPTPHSVEKSPSENTKPLTKTSPPETPAKASRVSPQGPDKHSPINTDQKVYRVGLSKRARIEPLLRIVRK
ncbi:uncharacterized protein KY384_007823 [Bacidia gigantensis]|uniref:uncharacterized protein n=1 Tax=Bacidia gigantensis TaxID=2732470 RepID=UPI001D0451BC|nr:uncharacterized protein KY384_007823 [Bacidia gigantensis]KAG8527670.1 hypothetical protein KY384_007823 [Bacidia gigantensis]